MPTGSYMSKIGAQQRHVAREAYERLRDVDRVVAETGITRRMVMKYTRGLRPLPKSHVRHTDEEYAAVERWLREEQGPIAEAARTFGISKTQLYRRFPDLGWTREEAARFAGQVSSLTKKLDRTTYA